MNTRRTYNLMLLFFFLPSPSFSSSFFSSSSSSESVTSFSFDFSTYNSIGKPMNSECFHQILHAALLQKLRLVFLQIANYLRTTLHLTVHHLCILLNCERATRARFPNILLIVVVLAYHPDFVGHEIRRVEAHAELTNHADVATRSHRLHEGLCATLGNGTKIVDQLILRHANTRILDSDGRIRFVWHDLDEEIWLRLNLVWVRDGLVPDLVQGIRSIAHQLSQEDLLAH